MKKIYALVTAITFFSVTLSGQNSWQKTYNTNSIFLGGGSVIQTLDGGFASVGTAPPPLTAGGNDIVLTKYDANGTVQWAQIYGGTMDEEGICLTQAPNGNYFLGGTEKSFSSTNANIYLVATDPTGAMLWSQYETSFSAIDNVQDIEATSTNGVTIFGNRGGSQGFFMTFDMNGVMLQNRTFDAGSAGNFRDVFGQKIAGGYIVAGTDRYATNSYSQLKIVKFNSALNPIKVKILGPINPYFTYAKSCLKNSAGQYLISGYTMAYGSGGYDGYVAKLDSNCNLLWFRTFGDVNNNYFYDLKETSDGGCIAVGYTDLNGNAILVKLNAVGQSEWQRQYDLGSAADRGYGVFQNSDGGYIIAGTSSPTWNTWLIKTDMNGAAGACNTSNWSGINLSCSPLFTDEPLGALGTIALTPAVASDNSRSVTATSLCSAPTCNVNAVFSPSASIVVDGTSVTFTNTSTNASSYAWYDGVTNFSTATSPSYIITTPGIHTIKLIASNGTCSDTAFYDINVTAVPVTATWQATYPNTSNSGYPRTITPTLDGGYASVGSNGLVKHDANGNVQWAKSYVGYSNYGNFNALTQAPDGSYYLVGNMIVKTDVDGNVLWGRRDTASGTGFMSSIYSTPANEVVVLNPYGPDLLVTKLNPNGSTNIARGCNVGSSLTESHGQQTSDGGYVFASKYTGNISIAKFTSTFVYSWSRQITATGNFEVKSVQQTSDGGYVISGYQNAYGQGGNDGYILKLTSTGTAQWFRAYGDAGDNRITFARQTSDGGYIACGYTGTSPNVNVILIKTGATGSVQWAQEYNMGGEDAANTVYQTSDGGYIIGGRNNTNGNTFLIKTDATGTAGGCGTTTWGGIAFSYTPTNTATSSTVFNYTFIGSQFTASNPVLRTKTLICSQVICSNTASITFTPPTCFSACNATATCTPTGVGPFTYVWSNAQTTQTATGLCAGPYTVTVTDANSCTATAVVTVTQPTVLTLSSPVSSNALCFGDCNGSVNLNASGGTAPYSYSPSPSNLCAGTYTFTVTDANGCTSTSTATITQPTVVSANASSTYTSCGTCCTGTASSAPTGGTPGYTYLWSPGGQTTSSITGLCTGTYTVCVTDANGCTSCSTVTITFNVGISASLGVTNVVVYPNPFINEVFLSGIEGDAEITMFNLMGEVVGVWKTTTPNTELQTPNLPNGVYFLEVRTVFGTATQKLIKAK